MLRHLQPLLRPIASSWLLGRELLLRAGEQARPALACALVAPAPAPAAPSGADSWAGALWLAVQKTRSSQARKRIRQTGKILARGPKPKGHLYMCPVCERMRAPHRVCGREDCQTYFRHRWY